MEKLIITAAICGAEVTKEQNPAVPYTIEEIVREAKSASEAGAAVIHLHVREDDGTPTQSKDRYEEAIKDISAVSWVDKNTIPTVIAYGMYDKVQPYLGSVRLNEVLDKNGVQHDYFVMKHSGHGLQNDNKVYAEYMEKVEEYLDVYMPVDE